MRLFAALFLACLLPFGVTAQERPNTILVMDGSGSMWGQIDGINKIVIAREVVSEILGEFPDDQNLGLTVYGHRTRGDCTDIETVVAPAMGTAGRIIETVNGINPRGKTPMTDAVIAAAEALRYTEEKATVVLVSDGIETCNPDPCAAARAMEQAGIDFTAHVIGFDVTEPEALRQMQCLADETGGTFITASNAAELTQALAVVVEPEPEPEPILVSGTFTAMLDDGSVIADPVIWDLFADSTPVVEGQMANPLTVDDLAEGSYRASAYYTTQETAQDALFTISGAGDISVTVTFETPLPTATISGPASAPQGATIEVDWTGPGGAGDYVAVGEIDGDPYVNYTYTEVGSPAALRMPPLPGQYELRYFTDGGELLASQPIEAMPVDVGLDLPATAEVGAMIDVGWTGPDYIDDYIAVTQPGSDTAITYAYTSISNPAVLTMPGEPGTYDVTYTLEQDNTVIYRASIEVTPVKADIAAPDTAVAGSTVMVGFDGPEYQNDYLAISAPDDPDGYVNYVYVREGNPAALIMPTEPGTYEIRYVMNQDRQIIGRKSIEVTEVTSQVVAPDTAIAGSDIPVGWIGPDYQNDFIAVSTPGEDTYVNYTYTREGNPLTLSMPTEPGTYEIRYYLNQDREIIARTSIEVTEVGATLSAAPSAVAGSTLPVTWTGPDYQNDFIAVSRLDDDGYENYVYTRGGDPAQLVMPTEPGAYEIRYFLNQDREVIARRAIEVTAVGASLDAPDEAPVGSTVTVAWDGPDYQNDFIAVGIPGDARNYVNYTYSRTGNPLELQMPVEPGDYEIRYYVNQDREIIASRPITVTPLKVELSAPDTGAVGEPVTVGYDGPDYQNDFIAVSVPSEDGYINYTYTRQGNPVTVDMPSEPGTYELRYYINQDRRIMVRVPIEVRELSVTVVAPPEGLAGETLIVGHDGPDYQNDYIGISRPGDTGYETYAYTRNGNPLEVRLPEEPGTYEVRYYMNQDRRVLGMTTIEVTKP
ncbi:VWA domain-containing protein [Roseisalinus antarcticus]|uniref:von Willebrand factor type A domain protein n=1 Tax=Roseisalinus antarcticus TaxID=254357 RepID=A0A1Y5RHK9_9RHOB|nr:VWA domain-containing protein [Roseisalinus antarcticus]SLN17507.1 von Willebrand factor type A domain protein [Roseisalinus antarcticus]